MKLNQLTLFVTIAEEGQIGRAAARAGITQPALTKQLKNLEQSVGSPLFERNRSGVQLTQAGMLLLARARGILCSADEAQRELAELATGAIGHLRVGAGPTMVIQPNAMTPNRIDVGLFRIKRTEPFSKPGDQGIQRLVRYA